MDTVVKIVGVVFVVIGIIYLIKPGVIKSLMEFFKQGKRLYFAGLIRFALAIVFLLAARECDITWVIVVFGILFIISGLLIFILGLERLRSMIDWWQKQSLLLLRVIALITLALGAIILYSA
ncbi:MAG: hypothetical protein JSV82_05635 [Planctomycetota bacterium]|nr:MAG: hypothetical protein JSV82_05635 [Planctomycetota bacterium]